MKDVQNRYDVAYQEIERKNTVIVLVLWSSILAVVIALNIYIQTITSSFIYMPSFSWWPFIIAAVISLTLMVYPLIVLTKASKDINNMCSGDDRHMMPFVLAWLLGCVTMGIYMIYYMYVMQKRLHDKAPEYGVKVSVAGRELVLWILLFSPLLGSGIIVGIGIILFSFNKVAEGYNKTLYMDYSNSEDDLQVVQQTRALRCISGELRGSSIIMSDGDEIIIGRDPKMSDLVVNDSKVSRRHCKVTYDGRKGMFFVTDYSSNGTTLGDGRKLEKNIDTPITEGTVINLSSETSFTVK